MEFLDKAPDGASPVSTAESVSLTPEPVGKHVIPGFTPRVPVKFQNVDGAWVGMAQPKAALTQFVNGILGDQEFKDHKMLQAVMMKVTALLHITDIDDKAIEKPTNWIDYLELEQKLGPDGVDLAQFAWMQAFPPITEKQLVLVKK
jgi:hypothetical protein